MRLQIGNPALDNTLDSEGGLTFLWSHGLISYQTAQVVMKYCDFTQERVSSACNQSLSELSNELGQYINAYDVIADICTTSSTAQQMRLMMKTMKV